MIVSPISQARLKEVLDYDSGTGLFTWKVTNSNAAKADKLAGCLNTNGYRVIRIDGRLYRAGRLAWLYIKGYWPIEVDHKNTITADDSFDNLREATSQQNKINRSVRSDSLSQVKGVVRLPSGKYHAYITRNYTKITIGTFPTIAEAIAARNFAAKDLDGNE